MFLSNGWLCQKEIAKNQNQYDGLDQNMNIVFADNYEGYFFFSFFFARCAVGVSTLLLYYYLPVLCVYRARIERDRSEIQSNLISLRVYWIFGQRLYWQLVLIRWICARYWQTVFTHLFLLRFSRARWMKSMVRRLIVIYELWFLCLRAFYYFICLAFEIEWESDRYRYEMRDIECDWIENVLFLFLLLIFRFDTNFTTRQFIC